MGVEFNTCSACDEVYCDAEPTYHCQKCKYTICERCEQKYSEIHQDDPCICPFCCGDIITDAMKFKEIEELLKKFECPEFIRIINPIRRILEK